MDFSFGSSRPPYSYQSIKIMTKKPHNTAFGDKNITYIGKHSTLLFSGTLRVSREEQEK